MTVTVANVIVTPKPALILLKPKKKNSLSHQGLLLCHLDTRRDHNTSAMIQPWSFDTMIKCDVELINKKTIGELYERESEPGESGSAEHSIFSIQLKHYIACMDIGKLEPYPKK